jgi:hypothetical protein
MLMLIALCLASAQALEAVPSLSFGLKRVTRNRVLFSLDSRAGADTELAERGLKNSFGASVDVNLLNTFGGARLDAAYRGAFPFFWTVGVGAGHWRRGGDERDDGRQVYTMVFGGLKAKSASGWYIDGYGGLQLVFQIYPGLDSVGFGLGVEPLAGLEVYVLDNLSFTAEVSTPIMLLISPDRMRKAARFQINLRVGARFLF